MKNTKIKNIIINKLNEIKNVIETIKCIYINDDKNYNSISVYDKLLKEVYDFIKFLHGVKELRKYQNFFKILDSLRISINKLNYLIKTIIIINSNDEINYNNENLITFDNVFKLSDKNFIEKENKNLDLKNINKTIVLDNNYIFVEINIETSIDDINNNIRIKIDYIFDSTIEYVYKLLDNAINEIKINDYKINENNNKGKKKNLFNNNFNEKTDYSYDNTNEYKFNNNYTKQKNKTNIFDSNYHKNIEFTYDNQNKFYLKKKNYTKNKIKFSKNNSLNYYFKLFCFSIIFYAIINLKNKFKK